MSTHDDASATAQQAPSNWNIANGLTALRFALVPVFGWLLISGDDSTAWRWAAVVVFVLASVTDQVDGHLARSRGLVTDVGAVADPIADKLLTGVAFVGLSMLGELPWWATVSILVREWGVTALRFWVIRYGVISASPGGKLKTTLQMTLLVCFLVPLRDDFEQALDPVGAWVLTALLVATVVVTLATGADYVARAVRLRREGQAAT